MGRLEGQGLPQLRGKFGLQRGRVVAAVLGVATDATWPSLPVPSAARAALTRETPILTTF